MTDTFRSKHAGKPGSLMAIRVDYPLTTTAFESFPRDDPRSTRRAEVKKFTSGLRIGEKPDWNATTVDELHPFPSHSPQRTLSEFQGVKMEYNFRANALPSVNHDTIFVRKPNKMQIDASLFLTKQEKEKVVSVCPGTNARLSRREIQNRDGLDREQQWNNTTILPDERGSVFKLPSYDSCLELNKTKGLVNTDTYVNPVRRHRIVCESHRDSKLQSRQTSPSLSARYLIDASRDGQSTHAAQEVSAGGTFVAPGAPAVFKMSNRSEWWEKNPLQGTISSLTGSENGHPLVASASLGGSRAASGEFSGHGR